MYENYTYCYMDRVLTDNTDKVKGFGLVFSDSHFTRIANMVTGADGIRALTNNDTLVKDFALDGDSLKCDSVNRIPIVSEDIKNCNKLIELEYRNNTLIDFIQYGLENEYVIVDVSIAEEENYVGTAISPFNQIEFSQSTMSVYVKIREDNTLHNVMLTYMDNSQMRVNGFYFAIPANKSLPDFVQLDKHAKFIGNKTLNNECYHVYQMVLMPLYSAVYCSYPSLINKALTLRVKYKNLIDCLDELKKVLYCSSNYHLSDMKIEWGGSSKTYESQFGVYFKSSLESLSKDTKQRLISWYLGKVNTGCESEEIKSLIGIEIVGTLQELCASVIHAVMTSASSIDDIIMNCEETMRELRVKQAYCDMYLYRVRLFSYLTQHRLALPTRPILIGSDENAYTIVEGRLFYGVN